MKKNYKILIPQEVVVIYFSSKSLLTLVGPIKSESIKLKVPITISNNRISLSKNKVVHLPNCIKRNLKSIGITFIALLKQCIVNVSYALNRKLKIVGVGYRIFEMKNSFNKDQWFVFKLGYCHLVYFKMQKKINLFCVKYTTLYVYGNSYLNLTKECSRIRGYKSPEPYKGKGVLYSDEKIILKEGKRI